MPEEPISPETAPSQEPLQPVKNRRISRRHLLITVVFILIIAAVAAGAYLVGSRSKKDVASNTSVSASKLTAKNASASAPNLPPAELLSGNTYLSSPQKMGNLGFFKDYKALGCDSNCVSDMDINYYEIGSTAKGKPIIVMTYLAGPGGEGMLFAIETTPQTYSLLAQDSFDDTSYASDWVPSLNGNASFDYKTKIDDISMPLTATVANQKMKVDFVPSGAKQLSMQYMSLMQNGMSSIRGGYHDDSKSSDIKKLGTQGNVSFYEVTADNETNYKVMEYHAAYKSLFSGSYQPNGEISGSSTALNIKWFSGVSNKSSYFSAGAGCGSTGYVIAKNVNPSQLTKVGTTPHGQAVYQLPDSNALVQETYTKDYDSGQYVNDKSLENLSVDQFAKQHAYFLAKNGLGEYVVFLREDMIVRGGCAKPVVYLYPQQKQQVSVEVGAKVVNSDPAYGSGWDNVTAYPDGSLAYKGKVYGSLFWDGYGYGSYPEINSGAIVKSSQAVKTVKSQLKQQGLNSQEINDFLAYWQPKIEAVSQPYIRLTWFNTAQMNNLAPLNITPRPQTLIRVFLDFQGLDKPYSLKPQNLYGLQRNGFTAVEWGGLARSGLSR